ncbi:TetR/AcrR family transcriptional regulator [Frankia canadensis]|nr:TetR/AcrR family transcriptional regulator [Frankia canadensis]
MVTSEARPGRPRDPAVDGRIFDAALTVYAERGWSGFSFEVVARVAGVGKNALYIRWRTREDLLVSALERFIIAVQDIDRGSVREDLRHVFASMIETFAGPADLAPLRVLLEAQAAPELFTRFATVAVSRLVAVRAAIERGVARGELRPDTDVVLLADLIGGAVISRSLTAPFDPAGSPVTDPAAFVDRVLDHVLSSSRR